jgi:hypothetical protein
MTLVDLPSQPLYAYLNDVCAGVEMMLPDMLAQRRLGDDAAYMGHEVFE